MAGPKEDRLKLMQATGMNLSPVFGLYPDDAGEVQDLLDAAGRPALPLEATDHLGTRQPALAGGGPARHHPCDRPARAEAGVHRRRPSPLRNACATSTNAARPARSATTKRPRNFILMMLVGMSDPGLVILPTHRLVSGLPAVPGQASRTAGRLLRVETVGTGDDAARDCWEIDRGRRPRKRCSASARSPTAAGTSPG